jgi:acyl carrier protein
MNRTNEVNKRIRQFIMHNFPLARQRSSIDGDSLLGSGIVDSMGVLELINFIEAEFQITVSEEDLLPENFQTIACLTAFVQEKLNGNLTPPSGE